MSLLVSKRVRLSGLGAEFMDDDTVEVAGESQGTALRRVDVLPQGCNDVVAVAGDQNANVL